MIILIISRSSNERTVNLMSDQSVQSASRNNWYSAIIMAYNHDNITLVIS